MSVYEFLNKSDIWAEQIENAPIDTITRVDLIVFCIIIGIVILFLNIYNKKKS